MRGCVAACQSAGVSNPFDGAPNRLPWAEIRSRGEQRVPLRRGLHTFRHERHLERREHRVDRADGALPLRVLVDPHERAPVELRELRREPAEDLETGGAGPDVVDRDPEAGAAQAGHRRLERREVLAADALAHVEHDAARDRLERRARAAQQRLLRVERVHVHEEQHALGHVAAVLRDALIERAGQRGAPSHALGREEQGAVRREQRLVAAHERLVAHDLLLAQRDHRLELGVDRREGAGQHGLQRRAVAVRHRLAGLLRERVTLHLRELAERDGAAHRVHERLGLDRLEQVLLRAVFDRVEGGVERGARGHEDDRHVEVVLPQLAEEVEAGELRHDDVAEHDVESFLREQREAVARVARTRHGEPVAFEEQAEDAEHCRLVVDDQDPARARRRGSGRCWHALIIGRRRVSALASAPYRQEAFPYASHSPRPGRARSSRRRSSGPGGSRRGTR